jgi:nitronate monooxygenase
MRILYALKSLWQLKTAALDENGEKEYWQAGKSVAGIHTIQSVAEIISDFTGKNRSRFH